MDYLPRIVESRLEAALASVPVVILDGARASGKTTTARRHAASELLLPRDLPLLQSDPGHYLAGLEPPVLIDEWQLAGVDLLWTIKGIVDQDPLPRRFLLTGSVEPATYGPTYPLTGRSARILMRPMNRAELAGRGTERPFLAHILESGRPPGGPKAEPFRLEQLTESGFPATRGMTDPSLLLDAYAVTVAQRAGDEGRDATRLLRAMRVLATLEGQAVPDQTIWNAADINKITWKAYDDLLQRTHLSVPLAAFESNRLKRLTSYPKRFLADVALACSLADLDAARLRNDPRAAGGYLESFVMQQLRPQVDALGGHASHLRTGAGEREVDAVVELGDHLFAFEVKHVARPKPEDAKQLAWLRDQWPERFRGGYVVHTGADVYPLGERLWAVPASLIAGASVQDDRGGAVTERSPGGVAPPPLPSA